MTTTHAPVAGSATDCTCGRTFASHMGRRNHLTAAAKRAANEEATAARMAEVKAEASLHVTAASLRDDADTLARLAALDAETYRSARPTMTLTAFGAALLDTAECEHGVPMTDPCGPCAIAGHEPVDVFDPFDHEGNEAADRAARGVLTEAELTAEADEPAVGARVLVRNDSLPGTVVGHAGPLVLVRVDRPAQPGQARTYQCTRRNLAPLDAAPEHAFTGWVTGSRACRYCDQPEAAHRHLADCRGCALVEPDGHAYESLIDVPLTVEELRALAANPAAEPGNRRAAAEELAAVDGLAVPDRSYTMRSTRFRQAATRSRTRTRVRRA